MDEEDIPFHEANAGRETLQGFAGFEGTNALLFMVSMFVGLLLMQGNANSGILASIGIGTIPVIVVSLYVFILKQGKPPSYDLELVEWLIAKLTRQNYFSPKYVERIKLDWVNPHREEWGHKKKKEGADGQDR